MAELFDPITLNWFHSDAPQTTTESNVGKVFRKGFNDPTYRTFRLEFGDWGASLWDFQNLSPVYFNNIMKADYDQYPAGLLDTSYLDKNNNQDSGKYSQVYSAYRYLKNRNEDTRAEYLKQFIVGLYEIQRKYPYIFQDISGVDQLNQFDAQRGQRIDKAEISVTCYEGLSLKMQTLMELYRKAAWDDVYQRWMLPLNLREFKMIIYIFERRTFHKLDDDGKFKIADFVGDLPVYAFECEPCEFIIENHMKQQYSQEYLKNSEFENTTIRIQVKNVKTYLTNGLMRDDSGSMTKRLLIYDLMDKIERQQTKADKIFAYVDKHGQSPSLATVNSMKSYYLSKNMLLLNEVNDLANLETYAARQAGFFGKSHLGNENHKFREIDDTANFYNFTDPLQLQNIEEPKVNYEWHAATVIGQDYWSSSIKGDVRNLFKASTWQEIGYKMLNVIVSGTTQIKVSPIYGQLLTSIFKNVLQGIEVSPQAMYVSYATTGPIKPMLKLDKTAYIEHKTYNNLDTEENPRQKLKDEAIDDPYNEKYLKEYSKYNKTIGVFKHNLTQKDDYSVDPMDKMNELEDYSVNPMNKMNELDENVNRINPEFENIEQTKYIEQDIEVEIDKEHEQPGLYKEQIDKEHEQPGLYKEKIDGPNVQPNMTNVNIDGDSGLTIDKNKVNVEKIVGLNDNIQNITSVIDEPSKVEKLKMDNIDQKRQQISTAMDQIIESKKGDVPDFNHVDNPEKSNEFKLNEINTETPTNEVKLNTIVESPKNNEFDLPEIESTKKSRDLDFNEITETTRGNEVGFKEIENQTPKNDVDFKTIEEERKQTGVDFNHIDKEHEANQINVFENIEEERVIPINKLKTLDNITKPSRSTLIEQLLEFDKESTNNEKIIQNTIIEGNVKIEENETSRLLQIFAENREGFQESFANRVIGLKNTLIEQNKQLVKNIPDQTIEDAREIKNVGMATIEETETIKANAILTGLADEDIRKMSLATLIALNDQLVESLDTTAGLNKKPITTTVDETKARDKRLIGGHIIEDPIKTK